MISFILNFTNQGDEMRLLMIHVDSFTCRVTERGRSRVYEEPAEKCIFLEEGIVLLVSVEKEDEGNLEEVCEEAVLEIGKIAKNLKVKDLLLHPFAHLFGKLSSPEDAVEGLVTLAGKLEEEGFHVKRTPFGWFHTLEIKAKGHPLSRVSRRFTASRENHR